jgi:GNAT superfamily N-acetyltransferase
MRVVRRSTTQDFPTCLEIIRGLPDFFTDDEREQVERDLACLGAWVICDGPSVIGFTVVQKRSELAAELLWMAVALNQRGRGSGTELLTHVLERLAAEGVSLVEVKTLDQSADYEPYDNTRAFWQQRGFHHIDTIDPMPGWPPGNPAALYVAALRPTVEVANSVTSPRLARAHRASKTQMPSQPILRLFA